MKLTKQERLILSNQYRILEKLCPEEADAFSKQRIAIEEGYPLEYDWKHLCDEMSETECEEVIDILSMFSSLVCSTLELKDKSGVELQKIKFPGFMIKVKLNKWHIRDI